VPVASLDAIGKARPDTREWIGAFGEEQGGGAFLYCRETVHTTSGLHARMFMPFGGVPEDPATGSAAVALAGAIHRFDTPPDGFHRRVIEQGFEMSRPSLITLTLEVDGQKLHNVRIGGHAVRVSEGQIRV
jgi:trans-2,3-dihydro-3-hydroxyanthranilate isomerase